MKIEWKTIDGSEQRLFTLDLRAVNTCGLSLRWHRRLRGEMDGARYHDAGLSWEVDRDTLTDPNDSRRALFNFADRHNL